MDCEKVRQVIFLYTDNEMEGEQLAVFSAHLTVCGDCARLMDYTSKLIEVFRRRCARRSAPDTLRARILDSLPHRSRPAPSPTAMT